MFLTAITSVQFLVRHPASYLPCSKICPYTFAAVLPILPHHKKHQSMGGAPPPMKPRLAEELVMEACEASITRHEWKVASLPSAWNGKQTEH